MSKEKKFNITTAKIIVYDGLVGSGSKYPRTQAEVARISHLPKSSVCNSASFLEKHGFIKRYKGAKGYNIYYTKGKNSSIMDEYSRMYFRHNKRINDEVDRRQLYIPITRTHLNGGWLTIPESVTSIEYGAFEIANNPISITIPKKVTVKQNGFTDCNNIMIIIQDKDTTFEEYSIYNVLHFNPNITVKAPMDYKIPENAINDAKITYIYPCVVTVNNGKTAEIGYFEGVTVTITADTAPEGKGFSGWTVVSGDVVLSDNKTATTTFTMPANAVEVTANYATAYTVTYDKGSGSGTPPTVGTKIHGETFIVNTEYTLTKEGYTQIGWKTGAESTDGTGAITTYSDDANVTLYPVWKEYVEPSNDGGFPIIIVAIVAVIAIAGVGAFFFLRGKP